MNDLIKADAVEPLQGHWLRLTFSDGAVKDVDLGEVLARGGVFSKQEVLDDFAAGRRRR